MDASGVMGEGGVAFFLNLRSCCIDDEEVVDERVVSTAGRPAGLHRCTYVFLVTEEAYYCYLHIRVHTSISLSDTHMQLAGTPHVRR